MKLLFLTLTLWRIPSVYFFRLIHTTNTYCYIKTLGERSARHQGRVRRGPGGGDAHPQRGAGGAGHAHAAGHHLHQDHEEPAQGHQARHGGYLYTQGEVCLNGIGGHLISKVIKNAN